MRGRADAAGICRCGHRYASHGYIGANHWCSDNWAGIKCPCFRYRRDRRADAGSALRLRAALAVTNE